MQISPRFGLGTAAVAVIALGGAAVFARGPGRVAVRVAGNPSDDVFFPALRIDEAPTAVNAAPTNAPPPAPEPEQPEPATGTVTIAGRDDAGTRENDGTEVGIPPGTYRISYVSGCYRPGKTKTSRWTARDLRVNYANRDTLGTPVGIAWPNHGTYATERACERAYDGSTRTIHHGGGPVTFWIADETAKDNEGKVALEYEAIDDPTGIRATLTCSATTTRNGDVIDVRGKTSPALAETPVAIALPTGGAAPERFRAETDAQGAFALAIPVADRPTENLAIEALWPVPDESLTQPSVPCVLPIAGAAPGLRSAGTWRDRTGTPKKPVYVPDDPYASARVRVNLETIPAAPIAITRIEYTRNPVTPEPSGKPIRFLRVVSDLDPAFTSNGTVRFTLTPQEIRAVGVPSSKLRVVQLSQDKKKWVTLPTADLSKGGRAITEGTVADAADFRNGFFALVVKP